MHSFQACRQCVSALMTTSKRRYLRQSSLNVPSLALPGPSAIEYFPSLIAYLFRLFEEEQQEYAKARRFIDVYESTMKLLSLMIMAEQFPKAGGASIS
jgi:hypothetical protein